MAEQARQLRQAIEAEEVRPFYQPIFDLRAQRVVGFEVLARWISPAGFETGPADFIPLAASAGLLNLLTRSLLKMACEEAARWPAELTLAVNVAPSQFPDESFPEIIETCARSGKFPLSRLVLEMTEDILEGSAEEATARTNELRSLGVQLAMDDFGVGDSNIRRLSLMEFDIIKIDRCVVNGITREKQTHRGLIAAIAVATSLGLQVIAEGVEEEWQAGVIQALGCSTIQGWLTGRPMPDSALDSFFACNDQARRSACYATPAAQPWPGSALSDVPMESAALLDRAR